MLERVLRAREARATHQTGSTGLIANLVMRRYRKDIPRYWRKGTPSRAAAE